MTVFPSSCRARKCLIFEVLVSPASREGARSSTPSPGPQGLSALTRVGIDLLRAALLVRGVAVEGARRGELAELVTDHVLGHEHGHELAAVVHRERHPDEFGRDGRAARPGLDELAVAALLGVVHLLEKVV